MDAILLAGGYATRLYPLTKDRPKALLPVGDQTILDRLVDILEQADEIRAMFLVSNAKFAGHFEAWAAGREFKKPITILNDGTTSNDDRLGAIGDIKFVLDNADVQTEDGVYVMGTDNLTEFEIMDLARLSIEKQASTIFACKVDEPKRLLRLGVVVLGDDDRVLEFEEKPTAPKTDMACPPFYCYTAEAIGLLDEYLDEGNNPDAPGHLVAWMIGRQPVYAARTHGVTYDIGTLESYETVCRLFDAKNE